MDEVVNMLQKKKCIFLCKGGSGDMNGRCRRRRERERTPAGAGTDSEREMFKNATIVEKTAQKCA